MRRGIDRETQLLACLMLTLVVMLFVFTTIVNVTRPATPRQHAVHDWIVRHI
jgi:hypothetical protein